MATEDNETLQRSQNDVPSAEAATDEAFQAYYVLGRAQNVSRDYESSLVSLERALALRPDDGPARAEKARALFYLHRREEAWAILDELLGEDTRFIASLVRAELLLESGDAARAAAVAAKALNQGAAGETAEALRFMRVKALLHAGDLAAAVQEFQTVGDNTPSSTELFDALLERLRIEKRWQDIVTLVDNRQSRGTVPLDLIGWKVGALQALGRHDDALRALPTIEFDPAAHHLARLRAVLLCDVGDFAGALDALKGVTESAAAPHSLLGLRGWVHQHLTGAEHVEQAERMYREAHRKAPEDLWYREGLAHALQHLPGRENEAMSEYRAIVREIEELMRKEEVDAYTACLAGWCCYCLDRLSDAAAYYSSALTMSQVGPAAEFDYGLILLSMGARGDARAQYERVVEGLGSTNPLRRGGLVYVALYDLRDAVRARGELDAIPETATIRTNLLAVLKAATDEYQESFPELAGQVRAYIESEERTVAAERVSARPGAELPSEQAARVRPSRQVSTVFLTPSAAECALLIPVALRPTEGVAVPMSLDGDVADLSEIRALYVTDAFLETAVASRGEFPLQSLVWQRLDTPAAASAAWTTQAEGERILNSLAVRLVRRAATHLARHGHAGPAESQIPALRAADLAAKIAYDESLLYQAALIRVAASSDMQSIDLPGLHSDVLHSSLRDAAGLRREARRHYSAEVTRHHDPAPTGDQSPVRYVGDNELVKTILTTAYKIAQIPDPDEQERQARYAAAEVEALAPLHESAAREREQVQQRLASHDRFYLESDDSILILARDPAFYSSNVLLNLTKPAVNCFAFATAARRLGGRRNRPTRG